MPFEYNQDILMMFWVYSIKYNLLVREFEKQYLNRTFVDAELDEYFIHDRSSNESVHDTTNRLINTCANLNWVDINSFLYMYMYIYMKKIFII
jgi:alpha,alpha-trehalase